MATVYSNRFIGAQGLSGSADYYVPAGHVAVVWCATVFHGIEASAIQLRFLAPAPIAFQVYQDVGASAAADIWEGRVVLYPGELLQVIADAGNADVTVSGYLLSLP